MNKTQLGQVERQQTLDIYRDGPTWHVVDRPARQTEDFDATLGADEGLYQPAASRTRRTGHKRNWNTMIVMDAGGRS